MGTAPRRFRFGRCLGRGSFGEVYAATMRSPGGLESPVAVKLLRADIDLEGDAVRRLRDEGRLLARLNHPAILKVFDLVTLRGRLALITELVDGADLADCIEGASMPVRPLVQALSQVASALDAASTTGGPDGPLNLVHRDVKPSNVRVDRHGQAKLLDFGIARFDASDREVRTASDLVVGSVPYMAPERFVEREVVSSSDVFSLGCTLFEGIAGKRFYGSSNVARISTLAMQPEVYRRTVAERIGALEVPESLKALLHTLVDIDPGSRPVAAEVAARLEELADDLHGPTLRMWCRERDWPEPAGLEGALEGVTLSEGELDAPEEATKASGMPELVDPAMATIDEGGPEEGAPVGTEFVRNPTPEGPTGSASGRPRLNLSPMATIEPGATAPAAPAPAPPAPDRTSQTLTPAESPVQTPEPLDRALRKPPVVQSKDSVWERPYTEEGERPAPKPPARPPVDPNARTVLRHDASDPPPSEPRPHDAPSGRGCGPIVTIAIVLLGLVLAGAALAIIALPGLWVLANSP
jgi:serine/threonine protein kinase